MEGRTDPTFLRPGVQLWEGWELVRRNAKIVFISNYYYSIIIIQIIYLSQLSNERNISKITIQQRKKVGQEFQIAQIECFFNHLVFKYQVKLMFTRTISDICKLHQHKVIFLYQNACEFFIKRKNRCTFRT